jgi:hypothetical protein
MMLFDGFCSDDGDSDHYVPVLSAREKSNIITRPYSSSSNHDSEVDELAFDKIVFITGPLFIVESVSQMRYQRGITIPSQIPVETNIAILGNSDIYESCTFIE